MKRNSMIVALLVALIVVATAYPASALVLNGQRPSTSNWTPGTAYTPFSHSSQMTGALFTSHGYWGNSNSQSEFAGFFLNSQSSNWRYDNKGCELETTPTPEPASMILFAAGLVGAGVYRRMKK